MRRIVSKHVLRCVLVSFALVGVHSMSGCASEEAPSLGPNGAGGSIATGGTPSATGGLVQYATGGVTGNTGGAATGGAATGGASPDGSAAGGSDGGAVEAGSGGSSDAAPDAPACVPPTTLLDTSTLPACNIGPECTDGKCFSIALMTGIGVSQSTLDLLANCDVDNKCVPNLFLQYTNKFLTKHCTSVAGAEGRCISKCVPQVSDQMDFLKQDVCEASELCAPCYDPRTGVDTGACTQGCDTGPTEPAVVFDKCCSGNGLCVPTSLVPVANQSQLGLDTCTGTDVLCAPNKLQDFTYVPKTCASIGGLEGRCLADCIPEIASQASRLPKADCDTGELCAPCYDPINLRSTGACNLNGDSPVDGPIEFALCCGDLGHCVPKTALTTDQQSLLGQDSCAASSDLCAPDIFADSTMKAEPCRALSTFDAEGRCVPACVPAVAARASQLEQGTCDPNYLCAPCYDPITRLTTGACDQNGDAPVETAKVFASCGNGRGVCAPKFLIPDTLEPAIPVDTCTGTDELCAPIEKALDINYKFPTCSAQIFPFLPVPGACVPTYLAGSLAIFLNASTCTKSGDLCAPCTNPLDQTNTHACD